MTDSRDRRKDQALRRRIDKLLGRVHEARAEIVERGLDAVHEEPDDDGDGNAERRARKPPDVDPADAHA